MSASRRLDGAAVAGEAHAFGQPPAPKTLELDPRLRALLDDETGRARDAGYALGLVDGQAQAGARVESLAAAIALAAAETGAQIAEARRSTIGGVVALAEAIAEAVIGRTPHDGGHSTLARVEQALEHLEDRPLTIVVHPVDEELLARALEGRSGLAVRADGRLTPGEARLEGGWSHADLTREAAWAAVREALGP